MSVTVSTTLGSMSGVADNSDGTYASTLTSSRTSGTATVSGSINGTPMVNRNKVIAALSAGLPSGAFIVWLDEVYPMYAKSRLRPEALIGIVGSTNHRFRMLTVFQRMLPLWGIAGQQEEVVDSDGAFAAGPAGVHHRVQCDQCDRDVRWMSGDARVAGAEDGMPAVEPVHGRAAGAWLALVAWRGRVAEVAAPDPLAQVAAHRGHVPQLRGRAEHQRLGDQREPLHHAGRPGHVAHPGQRPDPQPAARQVLDLVQR